MPAHNGEKLIIRLSNSAIRSTFGDIPCSDGSHFDPTAKPTSGGPSARNQQGSERRCHTPGRGLLVDEESGCFGIVHLLPGSKVHSSYVLRPPHDAVGRLVREFREEEREERKEWLDEEKLDRNLRDIKVDDAVVAYDDEMTRGDVEEMQAECERLVDESRGWCPDGFGDVWTFV